MLKNGIPSLPYWENSSVGVDIVNYIVLGKPFVDALLSKVLDLQLNNFYQTHFFELFFTLLVLALIIKKNNSVRLFWLIFSLALLDGQFNHLIRPDLGYGISLGLLACFFSLVHKNKTVRFFWGGFFSVISVIFFAAVGTLIVVSLTTYLLWQLKNGSNSLKQLLNYFYGQLLVIFITCSYLIFHLGIEEYFNLINIVLEYLKSSDKYIIDREKILTYGKVFCSFFLSPTGISFFPSLLILGFSNISSFKLLDDFHKNILTFTFISALIFLIFSIFMPLHFYVERIVWSTPFALCILSINYQNKFIYTDQYLRYFSLYIFIQQVIFHYGINKVLSVDFYILQVISTICNIFMLGLLFTIFKSNKNINTTNKPEKNFHKHVLLGIIILSFALNDNIVKIPKIYLNSKSDISESRLLELKNNISKNLNDLTNVTSIITNWPIEDFFDERYSLHAYSFFMVHRKSRKFLTGVPSIQPDLVIFITNKNKGKDYFLNNLSNLRSKIHLDKKNFSFQDHETIFVKGYGYKLFLSESTKNYNINYYEYSDIKYENVDLYFEKLKPIIFQQYIKSYDEKYNQHN
tara:strand:- start:53 stop:1780 length:1728 start_codon:yes stop_codon:yes gene_type:complete